MSPRRLSLTVILVLAVILAIDGGAWWWVTQRMLTEVATWEVVQSAQGISISSGTPERGGWPYAAEIMLPSVVAATSGNQASWQADQVVLRLSPLHPQTLIVTAHGNQTVRVGVAPPVIVTAAHLAAAIPLTLPQTVTIERPCRHRRLCRRAADHRVACGTAGRIRTGGDGGAAGHPRDDAAL